MVTGTFHVKTEVLVVPGECAGSVMPPEIGLIFCHNPVTSPSHGTHVTKQQKLNNLLLVC